MEIDPMQDDLDYSVPEQTNEEIMEEALQRLARLGNADRYGNSIGNEIAKDALRKIGKLLSREGMNSAYPI